MISFSLSWNTTAEDITYLAASFPVFSFYTKSLGLLNMKLARYVTRPKGNNRELDLSWESLLNEYNIFLFIYKDMSALKPNTMLFPWTFYFTSTGACLGFVSILIKNEN